MTYNVFGGTLNLAQSIISLIQHTYSKSARVSTGMSDVFSWAPLTSKPSCHITSHPGQFSLAIHPWVGRYFIKHAVYNKCG